MVIGLRLIVWALREVEVFESHNLLGGLGTGAVITARWWVSGHLGYVSEHPEPLESAFLATNSGRAEVPSFVAPFAHTLDWVMFLIDKSKVCTLGIVVVVGVVVGSAVVALLSRNFRRGGF